MSFDSHVFAPPRTRAQVGVFLISRGHDG